MSDIKTVSALLDIELFVNCPNDECDAYIDILKENETDDFNHDEDSFLLMQVFPSGNTTHDDFECDDITCTRCKTTFNVKGLEW